MKSKERCIASSGKTTGIKWRCSKRKWNGYSLCEYHYIQRRRGHWRRLYKATPVQIEELEAVTACQICDTEDTMRGLAVDHDHKTGRIRGRICQGCNGKIAWYEGRRDRINEYLDAN